MAQGSITVTDANGTQRQFQVTITSAGVYLANALTADPTGLNLAQVDPYGNQAFQAGGSRSALNLTAAVAIKATPGRIRRVIVLAPGSGSGAFTINDCATTGAAAAGNQIWSMAYNASANVAGAIFSLDWPCLVGIVLSAVPGAGSPIIAVSYD